MWFYKLAAGLSKGFVPLWLCAHNAGLGIADIRNINEYLRAKQIADAAEARKNRGE